jgi:hypothetical protein
MASTTQPSSLDKLVPGNPPYIGATDAAKAGMGGVWFIDGDATLWCAPFPERVQDKLFSYQNLWGTVTNSNRKLAVTIAHQHLLEEAGYPMAGGRHWVDMLSVTTPPQ